MSKEYGELLIEGKNVVKDFPLNSNSIKQSKMRALNDVSFKMYKARGLSVVGESGSGKSTTAKMIAKMYAPSNGVIEYKGRDIQEITSRKDLMAYREGIQMVWQDPFGSLNPTHNIFHHIARPLLIHKKIAPGNPKETGRAGLRSSGTGRPYSTKRDRSEVPPSAFWRPTSARQLSTQYCRRRGSGIGG